MHFKYQLTVRVDVGSAYLRDVMQDSACPSLLHKNRSFSRGVTYAQREDSRIGFSSGSLNFKATEIVGETLKAAHASWKMDFSILISSRITESCFLCLFTVYNSGGLSPLNFFLRYIKIDNLLNWCNTDCS